LLLWLSSTVSLKGISFATLQSVLQFMYRGEVSLSQEELPLFLSAAETLEMKGLSGNAGTNESTSPAAQNPLRKVLEVDLNDKESIFAQQTVKNNKQAFVAEQSRKRTHEQSYSEQSAPKRMKVHDSTEAHSPTWSFDESESLALSKETLLVNNYTDMLEEAEIIYTVVLDFDTGKKNYFTFNIEIITNKIYISLNITASDEQLHDISVRDDQMPIAISNEDNSEVFADEIEESPQVRVVDKSDDGMIKCPFCEYRSVHNFNVTTHIRIQHTHKDDKPFKCGKCSYATKRNGDIKRHEKTCKN
jgi:hypothetical protein